MRAGRRVAYALPATGGGSTDAITWSSGAYLLHDASMVSGFGTFRDRPTGNVAVFPSHDTQSAIANTWWLASSVIPSGYTGDISIAMPMCADGQTVSTDISTQITSVANALNTFNGGINRFFIRLGWEMNLGGWPWKCTDANVTTWKSRWGTYADIFHGILGSRAVMVWNPNGGSNGGGTLTSTIDNAFVDGKVDAIGPDQYDCFPPFTSDSNVNTQRTRTQGLDWYASLARTKGVGLCLPEWGVSSGTQWSGNCGLDNPRYLTEMVDWMTDNADIFEFESWFDEPASYVESDIYVTSGSTHNPLAAARYAELFAQP